MVILGIATQKHFLTPPPPLQHYTSCYYHHHHYPLALQVLCPPLAPACTSVSASVVEGDGPGGRSSLSPPRRPSMLRRMRHMT